MAPGTILGRYVVRGRLGVGGMGLVLSAHDPVLDREVAIKLLHTVVQGSSEAAARLAREARALARLDHPSVVAVHDFGITDGHVWMVMDRVEGQTLGAWLAARPRAWNEIVAVMQAAGQGLAAAHAAGLVHGDVKPDNIMIDTQGRVRLIDFGLASGGPQPGARPQAGLTGPRSGTLGYMAPEQLLGCPSDARSDQFSLCVTLWEALFGRRLFQGPTGPEVLAQLLAAERPRPATQAPAWLVEACERGLAVDPRHRFASVQALLDALLDGPSRSRNEGVHSAVEGPTPTRWRSEPGDDRPTGRPARITPQREYPSAPSSPKGPRGPLDHRVLQGQALDLRVLQGDPQAALCHPQARAPRCPGAALSARRALRRRLHADRQRHDRARLLRRGRSLGLQ
ncbi:MAG: serine/threonine protein kinase [Myxococcales bacterium]|nr:serine/threonine protein kinase [Myxococcales bacterium]